MRAPGPATGPTHPLAHFIKPHRDALGPGLVFLRRRHPADPLIPRERRDVRPHAFRHPIGHDRLPQIRGEAVDGTGGELFSGFHMTSVILF